MPRVVARDDRAIEHLFERVAAGLAGFELDEVEHFGLALEHEVVKAEKDAAAASAARARAKAASASSSSAHGIRAMISPVNGVRAGMASRGVPARVTASGNFSHSDG